MKIHATLTVMGPVQTIQDGAAVPGELVVQGLVPNQRLFIDGRYVGMAHRVTPSVNFHFSDAITPYGATVRSTEVECVLDFDKIALAEAEAIIEGAERRLAGEAEHAPTAHEPHTES